MAFLQFVFYCCSLKDKTNLCSSRAFVYHSAAAVFFNMFLVRLFRMASAAKVGTKQILVTGPPGVGKTTFTRKICQELSRNFPNVKVAGFFTQEVRSGTGKERTGFEIVKLPEGDSERRASLATVSPPSGLNYPKVGKYSVLVEEFESIALETMKEGENAEILDELGKMESYSKRFCTAVSDWLKSDKKGILLATVPIAKGRPLPLVEEVQKVPGSVLVTLNRGNRDTKVKEVMETIASVFC